MHLQSIILPGEGRERINIMLAPSSDLVFAVEAMGGFFVGQTVQVCGIEVGDAHRLIDGDTDALSPYVHADPEIEGQFRLPRGGYLHTEAVGKPFGIIGVFKEHQPVDVGSAG